MSAREVDVVVVGGGPAGEVAAGRLADSGLDVALAEAELIGGECSYWACMPSKALLRPAELLAETRRVPGLPVGDELDVDRILARRDEVIHDLDDSSQLPWLEKRDITLLRGHAEIVGERRVRIGDEELTARRAVVVATGSAPAMPPIDGLADVGAWSNREVTTAKAVPESLLILGGGVVGVEMAQAWSSLGSEVTIVEGMGRILANEEEFASDQVGAALRDRGVVIRTGAEATAARRDEAAGTVVLEIDGDDTLEAAHLLVAVGRKARVEGLGLESVDAGTDGDPIEVDERMRVGGRDWLYAIGDVNGRSLLTHMGKYQARLACEHILGNPSAAEHGADGQRSPQVVFTDPQVAAVGHTEETARDAGLDFHILETGTSANAGGSFYGRKAPGTSRLLVDKESDLIIGATITGSEVADFLHAATIAIVGEVPMGRLWHATPSFPTRSEIWLKLMEKWETAKGAG